MAYCDRCERYFTSKFALSQHERDSAAHNTCDTCDIDFSTWTGLKQHWIQSPRHDYCQHCEEHFDDEMDLEEHYENDHIYCSSCQKIFRSQHGLEQHYQKSAAHHYCSSCERHFRSESNLQSHLNSSIHRPKDVTCPFRGCIQAFVSRSALILHLESGKCSSGVDRATINRVVRKYDKNNVITDPSRLLTGSGATEEVTYHATRASWNGSAYECYLCHRTYSTLHVLNQHIGSPRHQGKIYLCPLSSCHVRFTTLSALCQHIESEKCGVSKFRNVQSTMDKIVGRMGRLTF